MHFSSNKTHENKYYGFINQSVKNKFNEKFGKIIDWNCCKKQPRTLNTENLGAWTRTSLEYIVSLEGPLEPWQLCNICHFTQSVLVSDHLHVLIELYLIGYYYESLLSLEVENTVIRSLLSGAFTFIPFNMWYFLVRLYAILPTGMHSLWHNILIEIKALYCALISVALYIMFCSVTPRPLFVPLAINLCTSIAQYWFVTGKDLSVN